MPRHHRVLPGGYVYHVLNRGCERRTIFEEWADYQTFIDLMVKAHDRVPMRVCALQLMSTHWHLLLWPQKDGAVSAYMHWLCTMHSLQHRRSHGTVGMGHLYQDRFHCFPVQDDRYYYHVVHYIETNAKRAGLVSRAEAWPWSSVADRINGTGLTVPGPLPLPRN